MLRLHTIKRDFDYITGQMGYSYETLEFGSMSGCVGEYTYEYWDSPYTSLISSGNIHGSGGHDTLMVTVFNDIFRKKSENDLIPCFIHEYQNESVIKKIAKLIGINDFNDPAHIIMMTYRNINFEESLSIPNKEKLRELKYDFMKKIDIDGVSYHKFQNLNKGGNFPSPPSFKIIR